MWFSLNANANPLNSPIRSGFLIVVEVSSLSRLVMQVKSAGLLYTARNSLDVLLMFRGGLVFHEKPTMASVEEHVSHTSRDPFTGVEKTTCMVGSGRRSAV